MPTPLPITDRPVRVAVVGLGQIAKLCLPAYLGRTDVEIVGLCDLDAEHVAVWKTTFPDAVATTDLDVLLRIDADVIDVLVPTPLHADVVCRVLDAGYHVQVQKPLARSLDDADRMLELAAASGATLRVLEDYVFFPPVVQLRDVVRDGAIGAPVGLHMKIVGNGLGGWDVDPASYVWQFERATVAGYARCNRISAQGIQEPSVVVYADGEVRAFHALADRPPDAFAAQAAHGIEFFRGASSKPVLDGVDARNVLEVLLCGLDSAGRGVPVDIPSSGESAGTEHVWTP
jgi:hypothetical protein